MQKNSLALIFSAIFGIAAFVSQAHAYGEPREILSWKVISRDLVGCNFQYENLDITGDISELDRPALKIVAGAPVRFCLTAVDIGAKRLERTVLTFSAEMKSEDFAGAAYPEIWVHTMGAGNSIARGLERPLRGTTGWSKYTVAVGLGAGALPDKVTLHLGLAGKGAVWLRNVKLEYAP
jgi:hypothetical protein